MHMQCTKGRHSSQVLILRSLPLPTKHSNAKEEGMMRRAWKKRTDVIEENAVVMWHESVVGRMGVMLICQPISGTDGARAKSCETRHKDKNGKGRAVKD